MAEDRIGFSGRVIVPFPDAGVVLPPDDLFLPLDRVLCLPCRTHTASTAACTDRTCVPCTKKGCAQCAGALDEGHAAGLVPQRGSLTLDLTRSNAIQTPLGVTATPVVFAIRVGTPNGAFEKYRGRWAPLLPASRVRAGDLVDLALPAAQYIEIWAGLRPEQVRAGQMMPYEWCIDVTWLRCCEASHPYARPGRDVTTLYSWAGD